MIRDMDLLRALLLKLEALPMRPGSVEHIMPNEDAVQVEGFTPDQIAYHLDLLLDSGLIDPGGYRAAEGIGFRKLTPKGHDFADSIRDSEVWQKTKKGASAAGGFTLQLIADLAKGLVKKKIEDHTGVKL